MRIYVDVCDVCQDPSKPVKPYTVTTEDGSGQTLRCKEDGQVLQEIIDQNPAAKAAPVQRAEPKAKPGTRTRTRTTERPLKVSSMQEVTRAKRR